MSDTADGADPASAREYPIVDERHAAALSARLGVEASGLVGRPVSELGAVIGEKIDFFSLLYRRVCGRVVTRDAVGVLRGVPNATVHVEDTDCSFLGFAPVETPYWWLWPFGCSREEIAIAYTDACGNFCVWVPRWDIDRVIEFRRSRICYPDLYRLRLRDLLLNIGRLRIPPIPPDPNPPDPPYLDLRDRDVVQQVAGLAGPAVANQILALATKREWGSKHSELDDLLDGPAFAQPPRPPLRDEHFERLDVRLDRIGDAFAEDNVDSRAMLLERVPIGPFLRCRDVWLPEWQTIVDVPDITFRVTQDVDLDGDEEVIYDEGFFDVRWDADPILNQVLVASSWARASATCEGPEINCSTVPLLRSVGLMPLEPTHHDAGSGFALRPNQPRRPPGLLNSPQVDTSNNPYVSQAPYAGTLQLHGCHHIAGASFYRLVHREGPTAWVPFLGLEWWAPRLGPGGPIHFVPDADGWYPIVPESDLVFPHLLLNWPTGAQGRSEVVVEVADAGKNVLAASPAPIAFFIDNEAAAAQVTQIRWRVAGGAWLAPNVATWPFSCPVIHRTPGSNLELEVSWIASASYFRSASLGAAGCGGVAPALTSPLETVEHWYTDAVTDNVASGVASYTLAGSALAGCYTWSVDGWTRAFNPAGDGGGPGVDWYASYDTGQGHGGVSVSIVDI